MRMGLCPKCRYEYEWHVSVCPECEVELVQPEPWAAPAVRYDPAIDADLAEQELVSVYRGYEEHSVRRIHAVLRAEGVRTAVRPFGVPFMPWLYDKLNDPLGAWGEVLVLEQDEAQAREIIEVVETGRIVAEDIPEAEE